MTRYDYNPGLTADNDDDLELYDEGIPERVPTLEALGGLLSGVAVTVAGVVYLVRRSARRA